MTGRILEITTGPAGISLQIRARIVDRDTGFVLDALTPAQARGWANQLVAAAERQEAETLSRLRDQRDFHAERLSALTLQVGEIEAALAGAAWSPLTASDFMARRA